jgi:hypothetical protein
LRLEIDALTHEVAVDRYIRKSDQTVAK